MRAAQLADIEAAARVLLCADRCDRDAAMASLYDQANIADRYRKRLRRPHPAFGSGTLMSAAAGFRMARRPPRCDLDYLECIGIVATFLSKRATDQMR